MWDLFQRARMATVDSGSPYKVTLTKSTPLVSLTEQGSASGHLRINLTWSMRPTELNQPRQRSSLLRRPLSLFEPQVVQAQGPAMVNVDLDLGCMYELKDGTKGVVQPLGKLFGDLHKPPYVETSGDDRFGAPSGETLYVNLDKKDEFKRLLVFVYIYDGTPAFSRTQALVTLFPSMGPRIEIKLDERAPEARSCAVLLLENRKGHFLVRREVKYVYGFQSELDGLYGWGMQWARGYKGEDASGGDA
ncbi:Tellurium resistance [Wenjunlia vitaminophila]|uniref:Tellurium resistance n=1 Tax=Wenjunlia vitaminophila TaxID=76728 RepID=A0A0T6LKH6_WENVI|nr:hypothetical protein [Wenjunlia vitaminophila]KRV46536.1 Tellurium resistance [Wenjunlia vitaminophila]